MEPRSLMEERMKNGKRLVKPIPCDYSNLQPQEIHTEQIRLRREIERVAEHVRSLENHLTSLHEYEAILFKRKETLERLTVPTLVLKTRKPKEEKFSFIQNIIERNSIDEIEAILLEAREEGRI